MKLKILTIAAMAALATTSCSNGKTGSTDTDTLQKQATSKTEKNMKPIALTKDEFLTRVMNYEQNPSEWKYLGDKPCLIDFYASWCGPCKMLAPVLDELAAEYGDSIYVYKINTETEQELAAAFGIRSIPTLLFVPMDGQPQMTQGAMPKQSLRKAIDEIMLGK